MNLEIGDPRLRATDPAQITILNLQTLPPTPTIPAPQPTPTPVPDRTAQSDSGILIIGLTVVGIVVVGLVVVPIVFVWRR